MTGRALVIRGDAAHLPLPDASVDLIVTSPPYYALRSYTDGGVHYPGQIGSEATPADYIDALVECTAEWARVLKPTGSMFVDLGDKYDSGTTAPRTNPGTMKDGQGQGWHLGAPRSTVGRPKSLMLLPERYRIAAVDQLGLIARAVIVWAKPNGLPESVTDRVRRSHEDWVHLVKVPRYYSAVDEIREGYAPDTAAPYRAGYNPRKVDDARPSVNTKLGGDTYAENALGKLPGSVWSIPTEPLIVPDHLGVDHFAAFPTEWPRRLILGWSPPGICTACGEGRRPVTEIDRVELRQRDLPMRARLNGERIHGPDRRAGTHVLNRSAITGYVCACTPYTDHPGTGESSRLDTRTTGLAPRSRAHDVGNTPRTGPWREHHLDGWTPPPTRPSVILDPFGGTGTTALVASVLGRIGITIDRSADYSRLAAWRTQDPGERARALRVEKPAPVSNDQLTLDWEIG